MKTLRITLGILLTFIALNAFAGGYYGMTGAEKVPIEWLKGSLFKSYFLPSLFLFVVIGGMCLAAAIAAFRNSKLTRPLTFICACLLVSWIGIQISIIGYVSWMQPAILISSIVIAIIAYILPKNLNS